jgi:hypothetical protein
LAGTWRVEDFTLGPDGGVGDISESRVVIVGGADDLERLQANLRQRMAGIARLGLPIDAVRLVDPDGKEVYRWTRQDHQNT